MNKHTDTTTRTSSRREAAIGLTLAATGALAYAALLAVLSAPHATHTETTACIDRPSYTTCLPGLADQTQPDITVAPCGVHVPLTRTDVCIASDGTLTPTAQLYTVGDLHARHSAKVTLY